MAIKKFTGEYSFLSNFSEIRVRYNGITYASAETAFQLQKTPDEHIQKTYAYLSPKKAKAFGRQLKLRPDWEDVKISIMKDIIYAKFTQNEMLKEMLLRTFDEELIEGNKWHDNIWGSCTCRKCGNHGANNLGKILMKVRDKIRKEESDEQSEVYLMVKREEKIYKSLKKLFKTLSTDGALSHNCQIKCDFKPVQFDPFFNKMGKCQREYHESILSDYHVISDENIKDVSHSLACCGLHLDDIEVSLSSDNMVYFIIPRPAIYDKDVRYVLWGK